MHAEMCRVWSYIPKWCGFCRFPWQAYTTVGYGDSPVLLMRRSNVMIFVFEYVFIFHGMVFLDLIVLKMLSIAMRRKLVLSWLLSIFS